jgi:hypothetical protein
MGCHRANAKFDLLQLFKNPLKRLLRAQLKVVESRSRPQEIFSIASTHGAINGRDSLQTCAKSLTFQFVLAVPVLNEN